MLGRAGRALCRPAFRQRSAPLLPPIWIPAPAVGSRPKTFSHGRRSGVGGDDAKTYYDLLGVGRRANEDEIKAAFRKLALQTHPDAAGPVVERGKAGGVGVQSSSPPFPETLPSFHDLLTAYKTLTDRRKRDLYDMSLAARALDRAAGLAALDRHRQLHGSKRARRGVGAAWGEGGIPGWMQQQGVALAHRRDATREAAPERVDDEGPGAFDSTQALGGLGRTRDLDGAPVDEHGLSSELQGWAARWVAQAISHRVERIERVLESQESGDPFSGQSNGKDEAKRGNASGKTNDKKKENEKENEHVGRHPDETRDAQSSRGGDNACDAASGEFARDEQSRDSSSGESCKGGRSRASWSSSPNDGDGTSSTSSSSSSSSSSQSADLHAVFCAPFASVQTWKDELQDEFRGAVATALLGPEGEEPLPGELPLEFELEMRSDPASRDLAHVVWARTLLAVVREGGRELGKGNGDSGTGRVEHQSNGGVLEAPGQSRSTSPAVVQPDEDACVGGEPEGMDESQADLSADEESRPRRARDSASPSLAAENAGDRALTSPTFAAEDANARASATPPNASSSSTFNSTSVLRLVGPDGEDWAVALLDRDLGRVVVMCEGNLLASADDLGGFPAKSVLHDAFGRKNLLALWTRTPLVRHLTLMVPSSGRTVARAQRAWLPPRSLWAWGPRSPAHALGGWTVQRADGGEDPRVLILLLAAREIGWGTGGKGTQEKPNKGQTTM